MGADVEHDVEVTDASPGITGAIDTKVIGRDSATGSLLACTYSINVLHLFEFH